MARVKRTNKSKTSTKSRQSKRSSKSTSLNNKSSKNISKNQFAGETKLHQNLEKPLIPVWSTLTDPKLAAKDIYEKGQGQGSKIAMSNGFNIDKSIVSALKGGTDFVNKLSHAVQFYQTVKTTINEGFSLDRLSQLSPAISSTLQGLGVDKKSDLFKQIEKTSDYLVRVGNAYHKVKNTNWSDANSIVSLMNGLTDEKTGLMNLADVSAQAKYTINIVNQMTRMGIPNSVSGLRDLIKNSPLLNQIVGGILPETLKFLDTDGLRTLDSLVNGSLLKTFRGSLSNDFSKFFNGETRNHFSDYTDAQWFKRFKETLELIDPDIFYTDRLGKRILDLSQITFNGNIDFAEMIHRGAVISDEQDAIMLTMCNVFQKTDVRTELSRSFPRVIWRDSNININHYPHREHIHRLEVSLGVSS